MKKSTRLQKAHHFDQLISPETSRGRQTALFKKENQIYVKMELREYTLSPEINF